MKKPKSHTPAPLALAATAVGAASTQAALVQITLTGNQITALGGNSLNADLTGDGNDDAAFSLSTFSTFVGASSSFNYAKVRINGGFNSATFSRTSTTFTFPIGSMGTVTTSTNSFTTTLRLVNSVTTSDGLIPITFTDATYGGTIDAWLDVHADADSVDSGIYLQRVIWDDADLTTRPAAASATAAAYPEASAIPEPSSLALLALGAGGLATRRKRKAGKGKLPR